MRSATFESNVPASTWRGGGGGGQDSEIFIENGRFHGKQIAADLRQAACPGKRRTRGPASKKPVTSRGKRIADPASWNVGSG